MSFQYPTIQPASERTAAEEELRTLLTKAAPKQLRLVAATRKVLRKFLPTAHELIFEYPACIVIRYSPIDAGFLSVYAIRVSKDDVRIVFNSLLDAEDPESLLRGSALEPRWLHLASAAALKSPAVLNIIKYALASNVMPYERTGKGSVQVRSGKSKKKVTVKKTTKKAATKPVAKKRVSK